MEESHGQAERPSPTSRGLRSTQQPSSQTQQPPPPGGRQRRGTFIVGPDSSSSSSNSSRTNSGPSTEPSSPLPGQKPEEQHHHQQQQQQRRPESGGGGAGETETAVLDQTQTWPPHKENMYLAEDRDKRVKAILEVEEWAGTVKLVVIGSSGVGKTALLRLYCDHEWDPRLATSTIGIDFKTKRLLVGDEPYKVNIFDTAGQERFRTLSASYYRGAHGVILVYDITNRKTFLDLEGWFQEAKTCSTEVVVLCLVGAKLDKAADGGREVTTEEGRALAESHGALFYEVSAKTGENFREPFVGIVQRIVGTPGLLEAVRRKPVPDTLRLNRDDDYYTKPIIVVSLLHCCLSG